MSSPLIYMRYALKIERVAMSDTKSNLVSATTRTETALDVAAFVGSAVPWIGGPVSNVLGGISTGRKLARISEVLGRIVADLADFKSEVSEEYVKTEDFEELLEQTLRRASEERNDEKRNIYRSFLSNAIESPGEPYDEQLRFLRTLEEIQMDHLSVIQALSQEPSRNTGSMGSPGQTLRKRLPGMTEENITERIAQLNNMRITNMINLKIMMTGSGAEDLQYAVTPFGNRFLQYINKA